MTVIKYLEETANQFPNKIAIIDEFGEITFSNLRSSAMKLARVISKEVMGQRSCPVLIYLPKGIQSIVAFLGTAYSGNIYTPTDVKFPIKKVKSVLEELEPQVIITSRAGMDKLVENDVNARYIVIDEVDRQIELDNEEFEISNQIIDMDPVYVFFTSGSTGRPKGVTITHQSICDYIDWAADKFKVMEHEIIGNQAPFYFDNSILDIYLCLKTGATLHVIPEKLFSFPVRLMEYVNEKKMSFLFWVPSVLCRIANDKILDIVELNGVKKVLFCGEVMPNKQLNYWREKMKDVMFVNLYGPTEITDVCTYYIVNRMFLDDAPLPIGYPCENTDVFLLDKYDKKVSTPGIQGEICVRGRSLSVGYLNAEEITKKKFCQNPLNTKYPEKIYRTGDIGHYNTDGELMFDGRKDYQIKHMGHRIELGEIESSVIGLEGIEQAVSLYNDNKKQIVLVYIGYLSKGDIQKKLATRLPKYMIPTQYIGIDSFPHNQNGKIDRIKLKETYIN